MKINRPLWWNNEPNLCHHLDIYGAEIVTKEHDGKIFSQSCKHSWIYEYFDEDLIKLDYERPTPRNIKMEFGAGY